MNPACCLILLGQPRPDERSETREIIQVRKVVVHFVPVHSQVIVNQDVAESGDWGQLFGEVRREDSQISHAQDRLAVVARLLGAFECNDPVTNVNTALRGDLKVALNDISQVGIAAEISLWLVPQGRQACQALVEFVQAPFDTAELDVHLPLPPGCPGAAPAKKVDSLRSGS